MCPMSQAHCTWIDCRLWINPVVLLWPCFTEVQGQSWPSRNLEEGTHIVLVIFSPLEKYLIFNLKSRVFFDSRLRLQIWFMVACLLGCLSAAWWEGMVGKAAPAMATRKQREKERARQKHTPPRSLLWWPASPSQALFPDSTFSCVLGTGLIHYECSASLI